MKQSPRFSAVRLLRGLVTMVGLIYLLMYLSVALLRIKYPFELEWMEGGLVDHVQRVLDGRMLYVPPHIEFVPYLYPPLYFYVSALFAKLVGIGFFPLRLLSFVSSLLCLVLLFRIVRRETSDTFSGFLAVGLFIATFRAGGAFLDIARIDSLFLMLYFLGVDLLRRDRGRLDHLFAGVAFALSFLTKQSALLMFLPIAGYVLFTQRRRALFLIGAFTAVAGGVSLTLNIASNGWYNYYLFKLPAHHALARSVWLSFWQNDMLGLFMAAIAVIFTYCIMRVFSRQPFMFWVCTLAGATAAAFSSRLHAGGYDNVLLPAFAVLAVMFAISIHWLLNLARQADTSVRHGWEIALYMLCLIQFARFVYDPIKQIPSSKDRERSAGFLAHIGAISNNIYMPWHGYICREIGGRTYAHWMAVEDLLQNNSPESAHLRWEIIDSFRRQRFDVVVLDNKFFPFFTEVEQDYERYSGRYRKSAFMQVTGSDSTPHYVFVKKQPPSPTRQMP